MMRDLMHQIVDRAYTFKVESDDPAFLKAIESWPRIAARSDEPRLDAVPFNEMELAQDGTT